MYHSFNIRVNRTKRFHLCKDPRTSFLRCSRPVSLDTDTRPGLPKYLTTVKGTLRLTLLRFVLGKKFFKFFLLLGDLLKSL